MLLYVIYSMYCFVFYLESDSVIKFCFDICWTCSEYFVVTLFASIPLSPIFVPVQERACVCHKRSYSMSLKCHIIVFQ